MDCLEFSRHAYTLREKIQVFPLLSKQFFSSFYSIIKIEQKNSLEITLKNADFVTLVLSFFFRINNSSHRFNFLKTLKLVFSSFHSLKQWIYSLIFLTWFPQPTWCWDLISSNKQPCYVERFFNIARHPLHPHIKSDIWVCFLRVSLQSGSKALCTPGTGLFCIKLLCSLNVWRNANIW